MYDTYLNFKAGGYYDPNTGEWVSSSVAKQRWNWAFNKVVQVSTQQIC